MASSRKHEGYLLIDHRFSPGMTDEAMVKNGLPAGAGRGVFETSTYTCSHCQRVVIMNPQRTRAREYCAKCDRHICDECGRLYAMSGGECRSFMRLVEQVQREAELKI